MPKPELPFLGSKESDPTCLDLRANAAARRKSADFPQNKFRSWWFAIAHGATFDAVLPKLNRASMAAALGDVLAGAETFCCDGGKSIVAFARGAGLPVHVLPAPGGLRPDAPQFHINNVNGYHSRFKEWMRRFHGVATKNLPNYLGWRRSLEALAQEATPKRWILGAVELGPYQQKSP